MPKYKIVRIYKIEASSAQEADLLLCEAGDYYKYLVYESVPQEENTPAPSWFKLILLQLVGK